jgi:hypothetical protein
MPKTLPHGLAFAPVKVGVLIDIDIVNNESQNCRVRRERGPAEDYALLGLSPVTRQQLDLAHEEGRNP